MANKDNPNGFTAIGPILSSNVYLKATDAAIYPGDVVMYGTSGARHNKIQEAIAGSTNLAGIALGYASATATAVLVADDPDQQYYAQVDTTTLINARNCELLGTAGNATFLKSQHELEYTAVTTASAQFRVLDIHPSDAASNNSRHRVVINEHFYAKKLTNVAS